MAVKEQTVPATLIIIIALQEYLNRTGFKEKINGTSLFEKIYANSNDDPLTKEEIAGIIFEYGAEEIINEIIDEENRVGHRIKIKYCLYLAGLYYKTETNRALEELLTPVEPEEENDEDILSKNYCKQDWGYGASSR